MKTHELLDAANLNPADWRLTAGVFFGTPGEDYDDYLAEALGDLCSRKNDDVQFSCSSQRDKLAKEYPTLIDSRFRQRGTCDHCGAWFKYGAVYTHTSGVVCVVGNVCAEKTMSEIDRVTLVLKRAKRAAEVKAAQVKFAKLRDERLTAFLATDEGGKIAAFLTNKTEGFLGSLNSALHKYGRLTPAQHAAVWKIMTEPKRTAEPEVPSEFVGNVGERLQFDAVCVFVSEGRETQFGVNYTSIYKAGTNKLVHHGSNPIARKGERVTFRATVKKHDEYNGTRQTVIARPSNVTTVAGAPEVTP